MVECRRGLSLVPMSEYLFLDRMKFVSSGERDESVPRLIIVTVQLHVGQVI